VPIGLDHGSGSAAASGPAARREGHAGKALA